ncbi:hypothetical protein [Paenibacillus sp. FSL L8-0708]|uniref:hypothetical protein n=1 Tax=Paenibacillus sp. FSL L8-0708 TaxID=2975311 RepID=UPI0030F922F6
MGNKQNGKYTEDLTYEDKEKVIVAIIANLSYCEYALISITNSEVIHEYQIGLSFSLAMSSLYEALNIFSSIKGCIAETVQENPHLIDSWRSLTSKSTNKFKKEILQTVRNKSSFHVDPDTVGSLLSTNTYLKSLNLWDKYEGNDPEWSSPLARDLINFHLISVVDKANDKSWAFTFEQTYKNLTNFVKELSDIWLVKNNQISISS